MFRELARLISRLESVPSIVIDLRFLALAYGTEVLEGLADLTRALNDKPCGQLLVDGWHIGLGSGCNIPPVTTLELLQLRFASLSPSFRDWTIRSLNSSLVTGLSLTDTSISRNRLSLNENLHLLTLPALQFLTIRSRFPLMFQAVSPFLCRHPGVTELILNCGDLIVPGTPTLGVKALP